VSAIVIGLAMAVFAIAAFFFFKRLEMNAQPQLA